MVNNSNGNAKPSYLPITALNDNAMLVANRINVNDLVACQGNIKTVVRTDPETGKLWVTVIFMIFEPPQILQRTKSRQLQSKSLSIATDWFCPEVEEDETED